jgi:endonuclease/exonuclease/phosphatase family metal-dependent hydrolase
MHMAFGGNFIFQGGDYGNVVLSRWPIKAQKNHKLPSFDNGEPRGVLEAEIALSEKRGAITLLATHFDHRADERERIASAKTVLDLPLRHPALLAGDLNAPPESKTLEILSEQWKRANEQILPTIPVTKPARQIDYVLFTPASRWKLVEAKVLDEAVASDHRGLLAVLELIDEE